MEFANNKSSDQLVWELVNATTGYADGLAATNTPNSASSPYVAVTHNVAQLTPDIVVTNSLQKDFESGSVQAIQAQKLLERYAAASTFITPALLARALEGLRALPSSVRIVASKFAPLSSPTKPSTSEGDAGLSETARVSPTTDTTGCDALEKNLRHFRLSKELLPDNHPGQALEYPSTPPTVPLDSFQKVEYDVNKDLGAPLCDPVKTAIKAEQEQIYGNEKPDDG